MELAEHIFKSLTKGEKHQCLYLTTFLAYQLRKGYGLTSPYYLVLDNDVMNALQKPNLYKVRYAALILFFRGIREISNEFKILINPIIFYEFNGKKAFKNISEYEYGWESITRTVFQSGLPSVAAGLQGFRQAKNYYNRIEDDIKTIKAALTKINNTTWNIKLINKKGWICFPQHIAREKCPKVKMKIFSSKFTRMLLSNVIEKKIVNFQKNNGFIEDIRNNLPQGHSKLLELKKGKIKGIGDLALLSQCHIASQFHSNTNATCIGITFDKALSKALSYSSTIVISSEPMTGGESHESIERKSSKFDDEVAALNKMNYRSDNFFVSLTESIRDIDWLQAELKQILCDKE